MPKKYDRWVSCYLSCTHAGHELGLLSPETWFPEYHLNEDGEMVLVDKVQKPLNPTQQTLWKLYTDHIDELFYIVGDDKLGITHLGDAQQGTKYMDGLVFNEEGQQTILVVNNWAPFFGYKKKPDFIRHVWGTPSHRFGSNSIPMIIHRNLKMMYPRVDIKTYRHGLMELNGMLFDVAHKRAGPGIRNWTEGNVFRLYCQSLLEDELDDGNTPPVLVVGSHYHTRVEVVYVKFYQGMKHKITGIIVPSYQMMTNFAHDKTQSKHKLITGMAVVEIINGKIHDVIWLVQESDLRVKDVIK